MSWIIFLGETPKVIYLSQNTADRIKEDLINGELYHVGRLNIVTRSVLSKYIYRFMANLIKIPVGFFVEIDKLILKFMQRAQKVVLGKMNKL